MKWPAHFALDFLIALDMLITSATSSTLCLLLHLTSFESYMGPKSLLKILFLQTRNLLSQPFVGSQISLPYVSHMTGPDFGLVDLAFGALADVST